MCQKADEKKSKEDEQTLEELKTAHHHLQNVSWYKPVTLNELNCSCFCHNKHLINQAKSVCMEES